MQDEEEFNLDVDFENEDIGMLEDIEDFKEMDAPDIEFYVSDVEREFLNIDMKKGKQYRIISHKVIPIFKIFNSFLDRFDVEEMWLSTYGLNQKSLQKIIENIEKVDLFNLLASDRFRYESWAAKLHGFSSKKSNFNFVLDNNHSKIWLMKTRCGKYIVFEGSGNLSFAAKIEQYIAEDNKQAFDFHKNWMQKFFNKN